jgi:chromosome segregation protein
MENETKNIFENGATWLRADFHLHTIKDKEFQPIENPNDFFNQYIERLKSEQINIGVITNHNKFDKDEYVNLRKKAIKEQIWILPGVELSVNDGANGIHCLIVFDNEQWITNGEDYINQFLTSAFEGIANRENENTRCNYNLTETLKRLNEHRINGRNSFIVMAHVEQNSGFLKELDGGRIQQFAGNEIFRSFVLGFQKFRTYDQLAYLNNWFGNKLPAFVEGSDCKSIANVGKAHEQNGIAKKTFIKIGAFNFDALMYALLDAENRISDTLPTINKAWLKSISFTTNKWKGKKLSFNQGMNNFIGIRGSGKSTLLETVRYALDIPLGTNAHEPKYKERLVQNFLGSGGKIEVELIDQHQTTYIAERIYGETPTVYQLKNDGEKELQYNLKINAIVNKPLYYGQKDLSDIGGETSTEDLINKLMGDKLTSVKREIEEQGSKIIGIIADIKKVDKQEHTRIKPHNGQIILFGKKGHAEVVGLIGQVGGDALVIENETDVNSLVFTGGPVSLFSQTTKNPEHYKATAHQLRKTITSRGLDPSLLTVFNTICAQVDNRHEELAHFARNRSLILFVAGKESSNGKVLFQTCKSANPRSYAIENPEGISQKWFRSGDTVGVCGATSTPLWLMEQVAETVRNMP